MAPNWESHGVQCKVLLDLQKIGKLWFDALFFLLLVITKLSYFVQTDCRAATAKICQAVLGRSDYQLGHTKVFLKDAHDLFLEQERDRVLTRKILILQRSIRGWVYRRRYAIHHVGKNITKINATFIYIQWMHFWRKKKKKTVAFVNFELKMRLQLLASPQFLYSVDESYSAVWKLQFFHTFSLCGAAFSPI